jgi:peptidyl-prolyl cis-trans isomerase C
VRKDLPVAAIGILAVVLFCFGLSRFHPTYPPVQSHPFSTESAPRAAAAGNDPVVMRVNGAPITEREFKLYASNAPEQMRQMAMSPEGRKLFAQQLVTLKVLEEEGHRLGSDRDPEVATQTEFAKANMAANYALLKLVGKPTDAQLRTEYLKQLPQIIAPTLYHILVSCEGSPIPSRSGGNVSCQEAERKAREIATSIHSPEDFQRAAVSASDDTNTGANGGFIGPLRHGTLPPEVDQAVFALQPGTVSKPVRTQFGVHLFMVGAPQPEPFDKLRPMLEQRWKQEKMQQVLQDIGKKAKVDYDAKFFGPDAGRGAKRPS